MKKYRSGTKLKKKPELFTSSLKAEGNDLAPWYKLGCQFTRTESSYTSDKVGRSIGMAGLSVNKKINVYTLNIHRKQEITLVKN